MDAQAIRGQAIDRHLLGLKFQAIEDLAALPEIFMDTSYAVALHFNLSTSQVLSNKALLQGYVHVNKPLFAEQTLFNMQSNARTVLLTLQIFGDDQLTTMTLQICKNHIAVNPKPSDHVKCMILQKS